MQCLDAREIPFLVPDAGLSGTHWWLRAHQLMSINCYGCPKKSWPSKRVAAKFQSSQGVPEEKNGTGVGWLSTDIKHSSHLIHIISLGFKLRMHFTPIPSNKASPSFYNEIHAAPHRNAFLLHSPMMLEQLVLCKDHPIGVTAIQEKEHSVAKGREAFLCLISLPERWGNFYSFLMKPIVLLTPS